MQLRIRHFLIPLLLAAFFFLLIQPKMVLADEENSLSVSQDSFVTFAENEVYPDEKIITVPFYSFNQFCTWQFPYTDQFFTRSSSVFSPELAKASIGLTVSAFRNDKHEELDDQYKTFLGRAGFSDFFAFGYGEETSEATLAGVIAQKKIGDFTLIAAVPCGQGYEKEWAGNLHVGDEERHVGFNVAAQILEGHIADYIKEHEITGEKKLWISGFSRASAVSNLTAADMIESGEFSDVYAYLFGVPRTTKAPKAYAGIYNICGGFDPVTWFPLQQWGFERYGTDIFMPAQEVSSDYVEYVGGADRVSRILCNFPFIHSPYVNYQLHLMVEFMGELFPENSDYTEQFQGLLMETWKEFDGEHISEALTVALQKMDDLNAREEYAVNTFLEYFSMVGAQQLKGNKDQIANGQWDKNASTAVNYLREHMPYTYVNWIFSDNDPEKLYAPAVSYRRVILVGDVDVYVYKNGWLIGSATKDGKISQVNQWETNKDIFVSEVFLHRSKDETIVTLPMDAVYNLELYMGKTKSLAYYQVLGDQEILYSPGGEMHVYGLSKGLYGLVFDQTTTLPDLEVYEGSVLQERTTSYDYNPFVVMSTELDNSSTITLGGVLSSAFYVILGLIALGLICLIISIIHAARRKKRGRPYSPLYVIIPHCLLIAFFAMMTQFCTLNLVTIGIMKSVCAAATVLFILLLALRGLFRGLRAKEERGYQAQQKWKKIAGAIFSVVLAAFCVFTFLFYKNSPLTTYSTLNAIIYYAITMVLSAFAIYLFPVRTPKKQKEA